MKNNFLKILPLFLIFIFLITSGFGCKSPSGEVKEHQKPITLEYWRLYDDEDAFSEIIKAYRELHPNININYRKFRPEEYEQELLDALAEDRGPDIFSLNENLLRKYQAKIEPMPEEITMAYQVIKGTIKKETVAELRTKKTLSLRQIKDDYAEIVYKNLVLDNKIYGLPLSLESLIMLYNRDILNKSAITTPPTDWKSFQDAVQKINRFDKENNIIQSGTALGTGYNVSRSFDILSILMLQNDAVMTDASGYAIISKTKDKNYNPGLEAIKFYLDFASPTKNVYCWNSDLPDSLAAFLSGKVGFIFGYNYSIPIIRAQAPKLNLGVAPLPQVNPDNPKNYANYFIETVSKKSKNTNEAWDFVIFANQEEQVKKFLNKTNRPAALKSLINSQLEDEDLHASAVQTLTATNWYEGKDPLAAENAFKEMTENLLKATEEKEFNDIVKTAISKINQTFK
ncbi:MAG: extracellular solute-binding protein [Patescibacteria group bacterium]